MALMAVLRLSSRSMASTFCFWRKKRTKRREAKRMTMTNSKMVKPFWVVFICIYYSKFLGV